MTAIIGKNWKSTDLALLLLRIALGVIFIAHGWDKIQNMQATIGFFATLGFNSLFAYLVAYVEFLGGLAVLLGVAMRQATLALVVVMMFAIYLVKAYKGLLGGYEFDMMLLATALALSILGPGKWRILSK